MASFREWMNKWLVSASPITLANRLRIRSERGATAVEYGLMLLFITATIFVAVVFLSQQTSNTFQCTADSVAQHAVRC